MPISLWSGLSRIQFSDWVPWTAPRLPGFCSGPELLILFWEGEGGELGSGLGGGGVWKGMPLFLLTVTA